MKKTAIIMILMGLYFLNFSLVAKAELEQFDFYNIFDEHGSIMLLIDSETGYVEYANEAASKFYGYSIEQFQSINVREINTLNPEEIRKVMQDVTDKNQNYFIFDHRLANGEIRTVEVYSYPQTYKDKVLLFSIIHDITAKTVLEEKNRTITNSFFIVLGVTILFLLLFSILQLRSIRELRKKTDEINNSYELRQTFIDAHSNIAYLKDENFNYLFINKALEKFHNKDSSEIIGYNDFHLFNEGFATKIRKSDVDVIEKKTLVIDEVKLNDQIYSTTKFPVKLCNGNYGVGAYVRNVTEEYNIKRKEEKTLLRNIILIDILNKHFDSSEEQIDYLLNESLILTESKFGYIYLYSEEKKEFKLNSWSKDVMSECEIVEKMTTYQLEKTGIWGEVVRQRKPIVLNNFEEPNSLKKGYPKGHVILKKFMSIPLIIDGKIVAVLGLANKENDYDDNDVFQISLLMKGVWTAKERRETLVQLAVEREKYLQTLLSIGDGVMVVNREGKIEMLNKVAEKITGWKYTEARGKHYKEVFHILHEDEENTIDDPIEAVYTRDNVQELDNHAILVSKEGFRYYIEDSASPIKDNINNTIGVVLVFRDVTEKREQRNKIEYLSFHDYLTGLYNRRFFEEELSRLDTERNLPISIIMGDVNALKVTNDIFGHAIGDLLLQKAAAVIKNNCRLDDIIARWGGDEFIILLPKTKYDEAQEILTRIKDLFSKENIKAINGSISMGCSSKNEINEDILQTLEKAENNMYVDKSLDRINIKSTLLKTLTETFHRNSPKEKEHSSNVSEICQNIGREIGLSEVEVKKLKDASYLHDIGKIIIEGNVLDKKGSLTEDEWQLIKQHPIVGFRILNSSNDTLELADYILAHHEHWDGTGYPKGLKGEEIPMLARIISVAESYDAMVNSSFYKNAISEEDAIIEIQKNAGSQFDPDIVEIFVNLMQHLRPS
ncbi:MAG: HD domain-containing phosphohydrolase [Vulcanibacillus sp.]